MKKIFFTFLFFISTGYIFSQNRIDTISVTGFNGSLKAQAGNFNSADISGVLGYSSNIYSTTLYGSYLSRREHNRRNSDFLTHNIGVTFGANIPEVNNIFSNANIKFNVEHEAKNYSNYTRLDDRYISHYGFFLWNRPSGSDLHSFLPRHYNSLFLNSSIVSDKEKYFKYRVNIEFDKYKNKFDANPVKQFFLPNFIYIGHDIEETKFTFSAGGNYKYGGMDFSSDILLYNNSYFAHLPKEWDPESNKLYEYDKYYINKNSSVFGFFGSGSAELSNNFFIMAGLKFYAYSSLERFIKDKEDNKGTILPQLALKYENKNNFSLSLCFNPDLKIMDFQQLYKLNPFALYQDIVLSTSWVSSPVYQGINHLLTPINLFLRFDIPTIENLKILTDVGYLEEKNTPYFYAQEPYSEYKDMYVEYPNYLRDYYPYLPDATTKGIYFNLKMEYNINEFNKVSFAFNYQNKKIDSLRIPFVPQLGASLNYYLLLNNNKIKINPSIEFIGDRVSPVMYVWEMYTYGYNVFRENKEDAVLLVNLDAEYSIIKNLAINLTIINMLNSKYSYYANYQEYPFSIFAGLKLKW